MNAQSVLTVFLGFYLAETFCSFLLSFLNTRYAWQHRDQPPEYYKNLISQEQYQKHLEYTFTKARFSRCSQVFSLIVFLTFLKYGGFGFFDQLARSYTQNPYFQGLLFIYAISAFFSILDIPFILYSIFVIEEKFGFNKMTLKLYLLDSLKGIVLGLLLSTPLLCLLFWFMEKTGSVWWLYALAVLLGFQLILLFIFPIFLAPLFNKFTPLEPGSLKEKIEALAQKLNFQNSGIFVMDGSKRSGHGNAYFTGFGRSKRIVLYDTLLKSLNEDQVVGVLAHEIGHNKLNHIRTSFLVSSLFMTASLYLLSLLLPYSPFYEAFGIQTPSYAAALLLFGLCSGPFTFLLTPLFSALTRKHEYEADAFAFKNTGDSNALTQSLLVLDKDNLSNLWPHPWFSFFYYSHPTTSERIQAIQTHPQNPS
ncbi:MAG: M48 family metallopeptidase [Planctomycetota bacterium]